MQTITAKATYDTVEEIVNAPIFELNEDFWQDIRDPYTQEINLVLKNCKEILRNGFKTSAFEEEEFLENFELDIRKYTGDYIKKQFKDINSNLLRRFNQKFKSDDKGVQRNWMMLEEPAIRELWITTKTDIEAMFKHFKYIEIPIDLCS